ncbi:uncharacterized protein METZ01_LOCUS98577 [marine metagenome]|uniref:Uncharacterized protein n=1 Tax=marine metagenome TaxID=408172 RepID=A0A381W1F3_9ZZZZ
MQLNKQITLQGYAKVAQLIQSKRLYGRTRIVRRRSRFYWSCINCMGLDLGRIAINNFKGIIMLVLHTFYYWRQVLFYHNYLPNTSVVSKVAQVIPNH